MTVSQLGSFVHAHRCERSLLRSHAHADLVTDFEPPRGSKELDIRRLECWRLAYIPFTNYERTDGNQEETRSIRGIPLHHMVNQVGLAVGQLMLSQSKQVKPSYDDKMPCSVSCDLYAHA
jgi:hypothetical protein